MTDEELRRQMSRQITAIDERTKRIDEHVERIDAQLNDPIATEGGKSFYELCVEVISDGKRVRMGFRVMKWAAWGVVAVGLWWAQAKDGLGGIWSDITGR